MKFLFHLGHPAHFHLFKHVIKKLKEREHEVIIALKKKDVLIDLVQNEKLQYIDILPEGRKNSLFSLVISVLKKTKYLIRIVKDYKPQLMIGTSAEIGIVGKIKRIHSIIVIEDDWYKIPFFAFLAYPFGSNIIAPECCRVGIWQYKNISYPGYHELAYLSPKYFQPSKQKVHNLFKDKTKYFIIRLVDMTSHHDFGKTGITDKIAKNIIDIFKPHGHIYILSERDLPYCLEQYKINIPPEDIHDALYFADMYIGDSNTMAAEAAILGTPSIRFNDFISKSGYLEELEHKYHLTFGIPTKNVDKLYNKIRELVMIKNLKLDWQRRRDNMLLEKIEVTDFFVWFFEEYSCTNKSLRRNPDLISWRQSPTGFPVDE